MTKKLEIKNLPDLKSRIGIDISKLKNLAGRTIDSYKLKELQKDDGGVRIISQPNHELKAVQKTIQKKLFSELEFGNFSHYGTKDRSNITNALKHKGNKTILKFDLKSFFPSIRPERVLKSLLYEQGCSFSVASLLTKLTTYNFELPQGAPTSTSIANIVTARLQRRISNLAQQWGIKEFTIYCDDIVLSSNSFPDEFKERVRKIIEEEGFVIHPHKGGVLDKSKAQTVTGINIAHGTTVGKKKKIWRAERHHNLTKYKAGELSEEEFENSENKYFARKTYEKNVRNPK